MFFLIAGIQPKTVRLEENPRLCPQCGLATAYPTRVDHYLSVFFVPLLRVKKGQEQVICRRCGFGPPPAVGTAVVHTCPGCGRQTEAQYRFCPYCGHKL